MEKTRFVINGFNNLTLEEQADIMDFISGMTPNWTIEELEDDKKN